MRSLEASADAMKICEAHNGIIHVPQSENPFIEEKLKLAISEAAKVEDDYLRAMGGDLLKMYRNEYAGALSGILEGVTKGDLTMLKKSAEKFNAYSDWRDANKDKLAAP